MFLHFRDDLHVVADVTVRHEANDANVRLIVGWIKGSLDGLHHLGATIAIAPTQKCLRLLEVRRSGRHRLWKQYARVACEGDEVERVGGIKTVERELHRLLRFLDRKASHRTRRIQHKHEFLWRHVFRSDALGRLKYESEETAFVGAMCEQGVLNRLARDVVTKDEISVGNRRFVFESQSGTVSIGTLNVCGVSFGIDSIDDQTGVER